MATDSGDTGMMDLEKELTCSICTDLLYQPLTLLDCLHTFCGFCLQEWFAWQAAAAAQSRRTTSPYTCPSCRESVRDTKGGWMLATMLEGFIRAHPDKAKTEAEREDIAKSYKPGDEVLKPVRIQVGDEDSEDERMMQEVRELSMGAVDPEVAGRRRAEREARHRRRREAERYPPEELGRRQQPSRWASQQVQLTESRLRQHDPPEAQIEHQPSLRSLLSAGSEAEAQDVQAEILQSIYQEGMLEGIDLDHLTTQQEEELTERIAEAYRRRQRERRRERSRDRRSGQRGPETAPNRSPPQTDAAVDRSAGQNRSRPPIARPHLFEQTLEPSRGQARSVSSTGQRSDRSHTRQRSQGNDSPASRSATDLSLQPSSRNGQRERDARSRLSSTGRSVTDPHDGVSRQHLNRVRASSNETRAQAEPTQTAARRDRPTNASTSSLPTPSQPSATAPTSAALVQSPPDTPTAIALPQRPREIHPAISRAAFAPETIPSAPSISCNRCSKPSIQHTLHYNCPTCLSGAFNLCLTCYRSGAGCNHWFGFGFRAYERFYRHTPSPPQQDRPHILSPRRYLEPSSQASPEQSLLQEGAFCDSCLEPANTSYHYCNICLEGAWGFCARCVRRGHHCTHPLLPITHIAHASQHSDPRKVAFVGLPHLRQDSYVPLPVLNACAVCTRPIAPNSTRYHCYECNDGDHDICTDCYRALTTQGKIAEANGPSGWRRCLNSHRMAVIGYQDTLDGGHLRITVRERVGGVAFREDEISLSGRAPPGGYPPDGGVGMRCLAVWSYWRPEGVVDEVGFPRNAEVRECGDRNGDWFAGVYGGRKGLFPSNHVRRL